MHASADGRCSYRIGSILNPLAGKIREDARKKGKGAKTGAPHDWRGFYLSQYDWLKGSHMTKVGWLPNETDYSYCEFVASNTRCYHIHVEEVKGVDIVTAEYIVGYTEACDTLPCIC